jgi:hypothetical protein
VIARVRGRTRGPARPAAAAISLPRTPGRRPRRGARRAAEPVEAGGLIAIGGPPLGGKSVLAARLAEWLPHCLVLEARDDLSRAEPYWNPGGPGARSARDATASLLARARELWRRRRPGAPPVLVVVTRFGTVRERRRAKLATRVGGMRFLFAEAGSRGDVALRPFPLDALSGELLEARIARYEAALRAYRAVTRVEALALPALRLAQVQSRLDESVRQVLRAWA